jgi:transcription initiation factor TFIID subunit TAF12
MQLNRGFFAQGVMGGATSASTSASALANSLGQHQQQQHQQQQQQLSMSLGGTNSGSSMLMSSGTTGIGIGSMAHRRSNTLTSVMSGGERGQAAASSAGELLDDSNGHDDVRVTLCYVT